MSHVQKRGDRWQARYRGPDGRERSKRFDRKLDAERWLATQTGDQARGAWIDPARSRITFAELAEVWREQDRRQNRPTTHELNTGTLDRHVLPRFASWSIEDVTVAAVRGMLDEALAAGASTSAARRRVMVCRMVLEVAVAEERLARNVAKAVKLPAETSRPMRMLTPGQVEAVALAHPNAGHFAPLIYTAAYVGLRWGELAALRPESIDFLRRRIHVTEAQTEVRGELLIGPPKTKHGVRSASVPTGILELLSTHVTTEAVQGSGRLFPTVTGQPMRRGNYRRLWKRALADAGLDQGETAGLTFHELRHTAAALAIAEGAHPMVIRDRLGHASITTTMDTYGHLFPNADEALADALDARFREARGDAPADNLRTAGA